MIDFDIPFDRCGTAEKYDLREKIFGRADVTPLWVADTDFPSPSCLTQALCDRLNHPLYGYQVPRPSATLEAIAWWLEHSHKLSVQESDILLSPSVVTSMGVVIDALTEPGDHVGIFTPVYPPFFNMVEHNNRVCVTLPLRLVNNRYEMDFDALEPQLAGMKLLLLCSPQNPSGRVWEAQALNKLLALCQANGVLIFSDEIHSDIILPGFKHTNLLSLPQAQDSVVLAHSIAKTFNCAGLRASFMVIPNAKLRHRIVETQKKTHTDEINIFGKIALASVLSPAGRDYQEQLIRYVTDNHRLVEKKLTQALPEVSVMAPESTFLAWVNFSQLGLSPKALKSCLIHQARVGLSEGGFFGQAGEGYQRINVGTQRTVLSDALDRIVMALKNVVRNSS